MTSLCGDPPDPVGCVGFALDHPAEGPCGTCPCVGKLPMWHLVRLKHSWELHVPVNSSLIRDGEDLKTPTWAFSP